MKEKTMERISNTIHIFCVRVIINNQRRGGATKLRAQSNAATSPPPPPAGALTISGGTLFRDPLVTNNSAQLWKNVGQCAQPSPFRAWGIAEKSRKKPRKLPR